MSITSSRTIQIQYSGDVTLGVIQSALDNPTAFGEADYSTLSVGNNTIAAPIVSGFLVTAITIVPPAGNTTVITVKGIAGDTGIPLHITDPTSIAVNTTFASLILSVGTQVNGVRLIWT